MNNEKYNGWANYETWNVALWYNNDEAIYHTLNAVIEPVEPEEINDETAAEIVIGVFENFGLKKTLDGVELKSKAIDWSEIAEDLKEWFK